MAGTTFAGCELPFETSGLEAYAAKVDRICLLNYHRGVSGENQVEQLAKERHWGSPKAEAMIRYAWADALKSQYRMISELGPAPAEQAVMDRWHETVRERAQIYRRWGRAWATSAHKREGTLHMKLDLAKAKADHLAQLLPFHICGTRVGPPVKPPSERQLVKDPAVIYTADLPLDDRDLIHRGLGVYWLHQRAGKVIDVVSGAETLLVEVRLKRAYARRMIGSGLTLYRSRQDPSVTWLTIIPKAA